MENKNVYKMKLHENIAINTLIQVLRVPGGWVYTIRRNGEIGCVFVPFNNEFQ